MSSDQIVRKPLRVRERSRRTVDERLALRFPRPFGLLRRLGARLPPRSRVRQVLGWRAVRLGFEAFNRSDLEAALINYHRDVEFFPPVALVESGVVESSYRGHDGYRRFFREWLTAWGGYRAQSHELIDLGDRLLMLGRLEAYGEGSQAPVTQEYASLMTIRDGQVIRQQEYFDRADALEAVGLRQ